MSSPAPIAPLTADDAAARLSSPVAVYVAPTVVIEVSDAYFSKLIKINKIKLKRKLTSCFAASFAVQQLFIWNLI